MLVVGSAPQSGAGGDKEQLCVSLCHCRAHGDSLGLVLTLLSAPTALRERVLGEHLG